MTCCSGTNSSSSRGRSDFALALALTREPATRSTDFSRRIDAGMVADVAAHSVSPGCALTVQAECSSWTSHSGRGARLGDWNPG